MKTINMLAVLVLILSAASVALLALTVVQRPTVSINDMDVQAQNHSLTIPVTVMSRGPLGLSNITVTVQLSDVNGTPLMQGAGGPMSAPARSTILFPVTMCLSGGLPSSVVQALMTTDQDLTLTSNARAVVPPLAIVTASITGNYSWGAPLENLRVGTPELSSYSDGYAILSVPVSFNNHSPFFNISGMSNVSLSNSTNNDVGSGVLDINAPYETNYSGDLAINFTVPQDQQNLLFDDSNLSYAANWQIPTNVFELNLSEPLIVSWKAPISMLELGSFSITPFNSTQARLRFEISFTDNSSFLALGGSVSGTVFEGSNAVGSIGAYQLSVSPCSAFSGTLSGFVDDNAPGPLIVKLTFSTPIGEGSQDFVLG